MQFIKSCENIHKIYEGLKSLKLQQLKTRKNVLKISS
jgi:hypothetical protein